MHHWDRIFIANVFRFAEKRVASTISEIIDFYYFSGNRINFIGADGNASRKKIPLDFDLLSADFPDSLVNCHHDHQTSERETVD